MIASFEPEIRNDRHQPELLTAWTPSLDDGQIVRFKEEAIFYQRPCYDLTKVWRGFLRNCPIVGRGSLEMAWKSSCSRTRLYSRLTSAKVKRSSVREVILSYGIASRRFIMHRVSTPVVMTHSLFEAHSSCE